MSVLNKFLKYVSIDTASDHESTSSPTTKKQWNLAHELVKELQQLGVKQVTLSPFGVVYAFLPANVDTPLPSIGFIAHMDTSPDCSGENVKTKLISNYDGKKIILNAEQAIESDPAIIRSLRKHIGKTLVVTDGTTLLGADDKAGVAAIMEMVETLQTNPNIHHGNVHIAFTPDEEVGKGTDHFDVDFFHCDFAYTVDGGSVDEIEFENFNAASCHVEIKGLNTHPGGAKGIMINSQLIAMQFHGLLPKELDPTLTEKYQGFNHLTSMQGDVEKTTLDYIIRNHDKGLFEEQKAMFYRIQKQLNDQYKKPLIQVTIADSYYNMRDLLMKQPHVIAIAQQAIRDVGLQPISNPIRGGTDGARLTYMGLPCPNLGTGGYAFHGRNEYLVVEELNISVKIILQIIAIVASKKMSS